LFRYDEEYQNYNSGPHLQKVKYIDACINKYNLSFIDIVHKTREDVILFLEGKEKIVLPLKLKGYGAGHACIFEGVKDSKFYFRNMRHKNSSQEDFSFTREELLLHLQDSNIHTGWLVPSDNHTLLVTELELERTVNDLRRFKADVLKIYSVKLSKEEMNKYKDTHFKALFLDYYSMLEITDNPLKRELESLRAEYMETFKYDNIRIDKYVNIDKFMLLLDKLILMTEEYIEVT